MQKREQLLLLIVIIFIALLFILALTIFYPGVATEEGNINNGPTFSDIEDAPDTIIEYIRPESENERTVRTLGEEGEEPILIIEEETQEGDIQEEAPTIAQITDEKSTEERKEASAEKSSDASPVNAVKQVISPAPAAKPATGSPAASSRSTSIASTSSKPGVTRAPARQQARPAIERMYWVQLLSSPNYFTVLNVQDFLSRYGIGSIIVPKQVFSVLYMRVRVGPYYNRQEAEKFAFWFRNVRDLQGSYVSGENN